MEDDGNGTTQVQFLSFQNRIDVAQIIRKDYLWMPYVPNRKNISKAGRHSKHNFLHRFAYTETKRGLDDEIPTLLFYAPFELLKDVCQYFYTLMAGRVKDLRIMESHSCRWKNRKCYMRTEVQIIGLDEQFISLTEFTRLLVYKCKELCNCTVRHYRLETFLNL